MGAILWRFKSSPGQIHSARIDAHTPHDLMRAKSVSRSIQRLAEKQRSLSAQQVCESSAPKDAGSTISALIFEGKGRSSETCAQAPTVVGRSAGAQCEWPENPNLSRRSKCVERHPFPLFAALLRGSPYNISQQDTSGPFRSGQIRTRCVESENAKGTQQFPCFLPVRRFSHKQQ